MQIKLFYQHNFICIIRIFFVPLHKKYKNLLYESFYSKWGYS